MPNRRRTGSRRAGRRLIVILTIFLAIILLCYLAYYLYHYLFAPVDAADTKNQLVQIPAGSDAREISLLLAQKGLVRNAWAFRLWAKWKGWDDKLQAGSYLLSPAMSTPQICAVIASGEVNIKRFTVPEGTRLADIGRILEKDGICSQEEFQQALQKVKLPEELPPEAEKGLEGYLFPDTYLVEEETSAEEVVAMMLSRFVSVWEEEMAPLAQDSKMSMHQIVTLASIIEKEALLDEERPLVSAVFYNRLKKGMRLESCATVLYAVGKTDERITIQDLKVNNPYNTYKHGGLPPGPICSPGLASLLAAVQPADVDYLYFISNGDGTHHFSTTFKEHEQVRIEKEKEKEKKK
jgi:UPF0755 protein